MKYFIFSILLFCVQAIAQVDIQVDGHRRFYELKGENGISAQDAKDAYPLDCRQYPHRVIDGPDGEMGPSGEDGEDGQDVYLRYANLVDLQNIAIDNSGGIGGKGGKGGEGASGCNGGIPGMRGPRGKDGAHGDFGKVYLVKEETNLPRVNSTKILTLEALANGANKLSYLKWQKHEGLKDLLHFSSNTSDTYYTFDKKIEKRIIIQWNNFRDISQYLHTKIGVDLSDDGVQFNVYRGPLLKYRIVEGDDFATIIIEQVFSEESLINLELGKLRSSQFDLTLEVERKYNLSIPLKTTFNLTLYAVDPQNGELQLIGHFPMGDKFVSFDVDRFNLYIGKLNFPAHFKQKGTKLKVFLSVYRENLKQRRTYVLKGLFRI